VTNRKKPSGQKTAGKSKGSLLNTISKLEPVKINRNKFWTIIMKEHDPQQYAELLEVIRDYVNGGHTFNVFPQLAQLHTYLIGKDQNNKCKPIISVSRHTFSRFVERVRNGEEC